MIILLSITRVDTIHLTAILLIIKISLSKKKTQKNKLIYTIKLFLHLFCAYIYSYSQKINKSKKFQT